MHGKKNARLGIPEGGDTDMVEEEEHDTVRDTDSCRSESPTPASQLSNVVLTPPEMWPQRINQFIVKSVFGRVLKRAEIVEVLKKKFSVSQKNVTGLSRTQLMGVLATKLVKHQYCTVKEGEIKDMKKDITVVKDTHVQYSPLVWVVKARIRLV